MWKVAVVAHARQCFGGGLPELRQVLAQEGITDPLWFDPVAGTDAAAAILSAGTANLLATNLRIPTDDVSAAVRVGLHGDRRVIDTGSVNGEHFAVMAGAGFDARMIAGAALTALLSMRAGASVDA